MVALHNWSGWPGAWCLNCGADCLFEAAICDPRMDPETGQWDGGVTPPEFIQAPCPEPGSNRHNPYTKARHANPIGQ